MFNLLAAGVSPKWLEIARQKGYDVGALNDSSKIKEAAEKMMGEIKTLQNTTFEPFFFDFDDDANEEEFAVLLKSRKWTGIALGGGIRTIPQLSEHFTKVVNLVISEQPQAKLVFPLTPSEVVPQFKRFLPQLC